MPREFPFGSGSSLGLALGATAAIILSGCSGELTRPAPITAPQSPRAQAALTAPVADYTRLPLPTGEFGCGRANDVNNGGVVGGNVFVCGPSFVSRAALWINRDLVVLPALAPNGSSNVLAVGDDGTAVGFATDADGVARATAWRNGVLIPLPGGESSTAADIHGGVIVGSIVSGGVRIPAMWVHDQLITEALPAGFVGARFNSIAMGVVAGTGLNPINGIVRSVRAFRWFGPGQYQLLDLPSDAATVALGQVNDFQMVVGVVTGLGGSYSVYWPGGSTSPVTVPLPDGFIRSDLRAINDWGWLGGSLTAVGAIPVVSPAIYVTGHNAWFRLPNDDIFGTVFGLNDRREIVGTFSLTSPQPGLWEPNS
ncbi:MAG: hypothetical protein M3Z10_02120 [Gemmatimonadota bacterium]|nr:hypothetical protein [Gemmatimonadota bacterium]